ncbi:hypothetical protein [Streptomyces sp. NPDC016845]|uniref:hypothetical protein n=1 Tax=Streptomyces sp. NPDC016845 TaxID=3364972 RepID=UPI003790FA7F
MNPLTTVMVSGAVGGAGLALLVSELLPSAPRLGPAMARLHQPPTRQLPATAQPATTQHQMVGRWLLHKVPVNLPRTDLDLLGRPAEEFVLSKVLLTLFGLLAPSLFLGAWTLLGIDIALYVPGLVGVLLGGVCWVVPDLMLRRDAAQARAEAAHGIAVYLELVALRLAAGIAIESALEQAASVGRGWVFLRIQETLMRARIERGQQWAALKHLGERLGVPVLADVADFVQMSTQDGASVYDTVRHRAASLRTEQLAAEAAAANADTERMQAPQAVLCVLVMAAMAFPAVLNAFAQTS